MFAWIGNISNLFGYVLNFIYDLVGNYGLAIILFTLVAKIVLMPLTYLQQKGTKKSALISEEVKNIQKKYKGNDKKIQEETMKVYKDNNSSPFASCSSCITVIIQMILVLAMFYLVSEPLTYMRKIEPAVYREYEIRMYEETIAEKEKEQQEKEQKETTEEVKEPKKEEVKTENKEDKKEEPKEEEKTEDEIIKELRAKSGILRPQMEMIKRYRSENEMFDINTNFLGLDLTQIPTNALKTINIKDSTTYKAALTLVIPVLYMIVSIYNIILTSKKNKQKEEIKDPNVLEVEAVKVEKKTDQDEKSLVKKDNEKLDSEDIGDAMKDANKSMLYFLPVIMFTVTMSAPLSLALYWLANTLFSFAEKYLVDKVVDRQEKSEDTIEAKPAVKVKEDKKK